MTPEIIEQAEKKVIQKATEIAYMRSNSMEDFKLQSVMYQLCKDYIILGARLMEEELMKLDYHET